MTQAGYQVTINLSIKSKLAAARSSAFCDFCTELSLHLCHSKSAFINDYKFGISVNTYQ